MNYINLLNILVVQ